MIDKIIEFFRNKKPENDITYKKSSELGKIQNIIPIPIIKIPNNNKKNFIILDDNIDAADVTYLDLKQLNSIAEKLRHSGTQQLSQKQIKFIRTLSNSLFEILSKFNIDDFNILLFTGDMAAFSLFDAIDRGLKVDYGIFDILIGGYNQYNKEFRILNGIDVVAKILETNKDLSYRFYSGCSLDDNSIESVEFIEKIGISSGLKYFVISKDRDMDKKKKSILDIIRKFYESNNKY